MKSMRITGSRAIRPHIALIASLMLSLFVVHTSSVSVVAQKTSKKSNYGTIKILTSHSGYQILINGKPAGETTTDYRSLDLAPGAYNVEIPFSKGNRWAKELNVVGGTVICINLNYRPLPPAQDGQGNVEIIERGDIEGTICDCGPIEGAGRLLPVKPLPDKKRTPKKP
jgi:hypothetical protein